MILIVSGCGFSVTPGPGVGDIDAPPGPTIDAPVTIDAAPDAAIDAPPPPPPVWVVISTLMVPCNGVPVTSPIVLTTGVVYRLRASGECTTNSLNGSRGDAEFLGYNVGPTYDALDNIDNGIAINDTTPGPNKLPSWGTYTTTHAYQVDWTGTGSATTAMFHDTNPSNNTGSLTLTISAFQ